MSEKNKGFIIKDKRTFSEKNENQDIIDDKIDSEKTKTKSQALKGDNSSEKTETEIPLPEINFSTFIISLNASALVHLGVIKDPATNEKIMNLALGKQTIDILGMLEEKTKGNLTADEVEILKNILYNLRMAYVKQKKANTE